MKPDFPTAEDYSSERAQYPAMTVVDIGFLEAGITGPYSNTVLFDINQECMRLAVFEGEYRWHRHPDSDELFLVVDGELQIDFATGDQISLRQWQSIVIPAGTVHRTRAVRRTVNVTFESRSARTEFVEPPPQSSAREFPLTS